MALEIPIAGGDTSIAPELMATRVRMVTDLLRTCGARRVLDAGCGGGDYLDRLTAAGFNAVGVEYLPDKVAGTHAARIVRGSIESLPFPQGTFDAVLLNEVLEHVPDDRRGLGEIARVLAPGALLICFSPNRLFPFETHGVMRRPMGPPALVMVPGIPYVPQCVGSRLWRYWARNYWPWELRRLIRRAGFRIRDTSYLWLTFEGITRQQSAVIRRFRHAFRWTSRVCERTPVLRLFGTSQLIVAVKR